MRVRRRFAHLGVIFAVSLLAGGPMLGCNGDDDNNANNSQADIGQTDTGPADTGMGDVADEDTGMSDTGATDTGTADTGTADTGNTDTGTTDAGTDADADAPELCGEDERVEAGSCVACDAGTFKAAGDDPSGPDTICFEDDDCFAELGVDCDAFQEAYVKADEVNNQDVFGLAVALDASGETLVVGAEAAEVGTATDTSVAQGVVYVFVRSGSTWTQQAALQAPDALSSEYFGGVLDIDGDTIVAGESADEGASGSVYVFERTAGAWGQPTRLRASNAEPDDGFGSTLALDGDTLVVGAPYEKSGDSLGGDGADNDLPGAGAAYVFERSGGAWSQTEYLKPSNLDEQDTFGVAVAIDGDTIAVSSQREDSNATGVGGDQSNNDLQDSGAVYVFTRSSGAWSQQAYIKASNAGSFDGFGAKLALAGDTLAVGAPTENSLSSGVGGDQDNDVMCGTFPCRIGAVYVFTRSGSDWSQQAYIKPTNAREDSTNFGRGLALSADGDLLAAGSQTEDGGATGLDGDQSDMSSENSGAAYLYERDATGAWTSKAYIKPFHNEPNQRFGIALALDAAGARMVVGAMFENGTSTGINGDMTQQQGEFIGATYVYRLAP